MKKCQPYYKEISNINEILNRSTIESEINQLLNSFESQCKNLQYKKGIYIYGSPGAGKTQFILNLLQKLDYDIIKYDAGDVRNKSLIDTITSNNVSSQNVLDLMSRKKKKIAIVMDEIDGMNNGDKGGITSLIKLIRQKKTKKQRLEHQTLNPIICIGNYYMDKKIKELMKVCNVYELKTPTDTQIESIINMQIIGFPIEDKIITDKILRYVQGDLRKLEFIGNLYRKNPDLLMENLDNIFHMKSFNEDSKKTTQRLLRGPIPFEQHSKVMNETDRTIIALLWHENIVDAISQFPKDKSFPFYLRILENICYADYIDRITFQNQIWQFNEMSSIMKTFYNNKLYHEEFAKEPNSYKCDEIRFTKVLTKYSTEYNNMLFIYDLCQELDIDKKDLIAFFQELRLFYGKNFLNQADKSAEVDKLFEDYNIDKLDIKRIYRYLDKNVKHDISLAEDDISDDGLEL